MYKLLFTLTVVTLAISPLRSIEAQEGALLYRGRDLRDWVTQLQDADASNRADAADAIGNLGPHAKSAVPD